MDLIQETLTLIKKYGKIYIKDFEKNIIIRDEYLEYDFNMNSV